MTNWWDDPTIYYTSPTFDGFTTQIKYTAELREFFDQYFVDPMTTGQLIEAGRAQLFDFQYPLYNAAVKKDFETNIIRQFFFREIGFDTFGIFKFRLENWLNLNMPYYNKMYQSITIEDQKSPLDNSHRTEAYSGKTNRDKTDTIQDTKMNTITGLEKKTAITALEKKTTIDNLAKVTDVNGSTTNTTSNTANGFNREIESNTPDTRLQITTGVDGVGVIEYASQINEHKTIDTNSGTAKDTTLANTKETTNGGTTETTNGGTTETTNGSTLDTKNGSSIVNDDTIETFTRDTHGKIGIQSYGKLLKDYRENIARVDKMLYKEMNELFMLLY